MQINSIQNNSNQNFKAKFSNDPQTVSILKKIAKKKPKEVVLAIDLLKEAGTNDIIALRHFDNGKIGSIDIINKANEHFGPISSTTHGVSYYNLFEGLQNTWLSNYTRVSSAMSKIRDINELKENSKSAIKYIDANV